jgi:hypothetical protein
MFYNVFIYFKYTEKHYLGGKSLYKNFSFYENEKENTGKNLFFYFCAFLYFYFSRSIHSVIYLFLFVSHSVIVPLGIKHINTHINTHTHRQKLQCAYICLCFTSIAVIVVVVVVNIFNDITAIATTVTSSSPSNRHKFCNQILHRPVIDF